MQLPSSPEDRKKIRDAITEVAKIMQRVSDENSAMKDILKQNKDDYQISPKHMKKLAKVLLKNNFQDAKAENEEFEELYEVILNK